jgi:hypothetical protein
MTYKAFFMLDSNSFLLGFTPDGQCTTGGGNYMSGSLILFPHTVSIFIDAIFYFKQIGV